MTGVKSRGGATAGIEDLERATLANPELAREPYEYYRRLRNEAPVRVDPELKHYWITRREDVMAAQQNPAQFSSNSGLQFRSQYRPRAQKIWDDAQIQVRYTLLTADPPEHEEYRRFGMSLFPPKKVARMTAYIESVVDELINAFIDKGECDFMAEFCNLLPATIVSNEYGFPREDAKRFKHWAEGVIQLQTPGISEDQEMEYVSRVVELFRYLEGHLAEAEKKDPSKAIYNLATFAHRDGSPFTPLERAWMAMVIFIGGNDTTTGTLGSAMNFLCSRPDIQAELRAHPEKIEMFIEEVLRMEGATQTVTRVATQDIELHGTVIPAGSDVMVCNASANRDERYWEAPNEFRLDRRNARQHLAFGYGRHVCVGMHLARRELNIAFQAILKRMGNIRYRDPVNPPLNIPMSVFRGFGDMPIVFDKIA